MGNLLKIREYSLFSVRWPGSCDIHERGMRGISTIATVLVAGFLWAACNSTPMPIPPSVTIEFSQVSVEEEDPTPECMDSCLMVRGGPGAVPGGVW